MEETKVLKGSRSTALVETRPEIKLQLEEEQELPQVERWRRREERRQREKEHRREEEKRQRLCELVSLLHLLGLQRQEKERSRQEEEHKLEAERQRREEERRRLEGEERNRQEEERRRQEEARRRQEKEARLAARPRWEYKNVLIRASEAKDKTRKPGGIEASVGSYIHSQIEATLNSWGHEGWQLMSMEPHWFYERVGISLAAEVTRPVAIVAWYCTFMRQRVD